MCNRTPCTCCGYLPGIVTEPEPERLSFFERIWFLAIPCSVVIAVVLFWIEGGG